MWKHFNELRGKKQARSFPKMLNIKGGNLSSQKDIAEGFNYFFTTLSNLLPSSNEQYCDEQLRAYVKSKNQGDEKISIRNITTEEVCFYLQSIDPSKSAGLDGISPRIILHLPLTQEEHLSVTGKKCAPSTGKLPRRLAQEQCG